MRNRYKHNQQDRERTPEPSDPDVFFDREMQKVRDELRIKGWEWFAFPLGALVIYMFLFSFMLFF